GVAGSAGASGLGRVEQLVCGPGPALRPVLAPNHPDVVFEDPHTDTGLIGGSIDPHFEFADLPAGGIEPHPGELLVRAEPRIDAYAFGHLAESGAGSQTERLAAADLLPGLSIAR